MNSITAPSGIGATASTSGTAGSDFQTALVDLTVMSNILTHGTTENSDQISLGNTSASGPKILIATCAGGQVVSDTDMKNGTPSPGTRIAIKLPPILNGLSCHLTAAQWTRYKVKIYRPPAARNESDFEMSFEQAATSKAGTVSLSDERVPRVQRLGRPFSLAYLLIAWVNEQCFKCAAEGTDQRVKCGLAKYARKGEYWGPTVEKPGAQRNKIRWCVKEVIVVVVDSTEYVYYYDKGDLFLLNAGPEDRSLIEGRTFAD